MPTADTLTFNGITLDFDDDYEIGEYLNGDSCGGPWVVGDAEHEGQMGVWLTGITPAPTGSGSSTVATARQNGWQTSYPQEQGKNYQAFDGRGAAADQSYGITSPIKYTDSLEMPIPSPGSPVFLPVGTSATFSISNDPPVYVTSSKIAFIQKQMTLTVVASAPASDAFRPPPAFPSWGKSYAISDMLSDAAIIAKVNGVTGTGLVAAPTGTPTIASVEATIAHPYYYLCGLWNGYQVMPSDHMNWYGRNRARNVGVALLMMCVDRTDLGGSVDTIKTRLVQMGIDNWGTHEAGRVAYPNGGWFSGEDEAVAFAGVMLSDDDFKRHDLVSPYQWPGQFFYITQDVVDYPQTVKCTGTVASATSTTITVNTAGTNITNGESHKVDGVKIVVTGVTGNPTLVQERVLSGQFANPGGGSGRPSGSTAVCSVTVAWDTNPDATSTFEIFGFDASQIGDAWWGIQQSLSGIGPYNPQRSTPALNAEYMWNNIYSCYASSLAFMLMGEGSSYGVPAMYDCLDTFKADFIADPATYDPSQTPSAFQVNAVADYWDSYFTSATTPIAQARHIEGGA